MSGIIFIESESYIRILAQKGIHTQMNEDICQK